MIAAADAEVARIVALQQLQQVEAATRAAAAEAAAAPTSIAASRGGKRKEGGGGGKGKGGGVLNTPIAPKDTRMRSQRSGRVTVAQCYATLSTRGTTDTLKHVCTCVCLYTYIYGCVYT